MNKCVTTTLFSLCLFIASTTCLANEEFEINKENCNLTMKEIRKIVTDREAQKKALQNCMDKASKENWKNLSAKGLRIL